MTKRVFKAIYHACGLLLLIIVFSPSCKQGYSTPPVVSYPVNEAENLFPYQSFISEYEEKVEAGLIACNCPGAAIAVVANNTILMMKGFGKSSTAANDAINSESVFRIGSLSKGFASVLAGTFVERGVFSWNDIVHDIYPSFRLSDKDQTSRVSVRHILSHTSGLPRHAYTTLVEDGMKLDKIADRLSTVKLISDEGKLYSYQNAAYAMIEGVIQQTTDYSFADAINQKIFLPLGMDRASTSYRDIKSANDIAYPFRGQSTTRKISKKYYNAIAAGGVNASISDMAKWMQLLLGNRPDIISNHTLNEIFTPVINTYNKRRYYNRWEGVTNSSYGMGWRILQFNDRSVVYHGGFVNGYRGEIAIDREKGVGVCFLFNNTCSYTKKAVGEFLNLFESYQNQAVADSSSAKQR